MNAKNQLIEMAMGYFRSRVLVAAARLELADALHPGAKTAIELAEECHADAVALQRLLRALAGFGIVVETAPGAFALTSLGQPLRKDVADSAWPSILFWGDLLSDSWSFLTECVKTGESARDVMMREGYASRWSKDPNAGDIFRAVMGTAQAEDYQAIANSCGLAGAKVVADLGGGGGGLLVAVLKAHLKIEGMLVDRPEAVKAAERRIASEGLAQRCQLLGADLLQSVPAGAGVYLMKHVLHGYSDKDAATILRNCREALCPDGRLLVLEFVLPDQVSGGDESLERRLMSDLNMLAVTGGKERSEAEWRRLADASGLTWIAATCVSHDLVSVIELRR